MKAYWFDWTDEENSNLWKSPRTCSVNQKETREERVSNEEMHVIYHDKDSKRIGTITYSAKKLLL